MKIISHRGFWSNLEDKNTKVSFENTINFGFGTETDIRDFNSNLVISHDVPTETNLKFKSILTDFKNSDLLLALNIKSDGLQNLLQESLILYNISNYFVFDMSIPDTIPYLKMGFKVFGRQSEYEMLIPFYEHIKGIWLDAFESIWYKPELIKKHLENGKNVCIVSAELHKRNHIKHWEMLKSWDCIKNDNVILCTDFPEDAKIFFRS